MNTTVQVYWESPVPTKCDCCGGQIGARFYDAIVQGGRWGYMDHACWSRFNGRLGVGIGQRYERQMDGRYLKTGG